MKKVLKVIGLVAIAELPGLGIACLSNKVPQTVLTNALAGSDIYRTWHYESVQVYENPTNQPEK